MSARHLRLLVAPLTLALCFALFLINDQQPSGSSAASGAEYARPMPSLTGDAAVDHLKREGIYDRLMASIEADRYRITTASEEANDGSSGASFAAVNSAQHLRAEFSRDGLLLSPIRKSAQSKPSQKTARLGSQRKSARRDWQMRLRLYGYGYGDATQEVAARLTRTDGNRIETTYVARSSERPALSEWHVNSRAGLEHGFTIAERPGVNIVAEPLRVRMKVEGDLEARLVDGGGAVVFARRDRKEALRYDHLVVEDAHGKRLDARMEAGGGEVSIVVDEAGAAYPLTIDPLFTEVKKLTASDGVASDDFGISVGISNDTVIVGAWGDDLLTGSAYIFERNEGGADNWGEVQKLTASDGESFDQFGHSVGISSDTVVVGARDADSGKGASYIFVRECAPPPPCAQLPAELPAGTAGIDYSQSVTAIPIGGYYYSLLTGMLPPGFSLNPTTGLISGLTNITGSYTFTIRTQNQTGCSATQSYTLVIECPEISLNQESLPDGTVGTPYSTTLSATPATTGYTFAVTSGSLPNGLSLNATTGKIAGSPTKNGEFNFTITVTGFGSCSKSQQYKIIIGSVGCPMITLADLPNGTVGKIYSRSAAATPAGSYSYSLTMGSLPPGVTLYGPIGLLYGYPTLAGPYNFEITATNSSGCSGSRTYSVTINSK